MIRTLLSGAAAALAVATLPALAHVQVYQAALGAEANSNGTGWTRVTVDDHNFSLRVEASFSGLTGNVTASHIHCCTALPGAGNAGVASQLPSFSGFPTGGQSGVYDHTFDMTQASSWNPSFVSANGGSTGSAFSALLAGMDNGRAYLNIHTSFAPGGEIRGLLAPVPEPASVALMLAGLAAVGWSARRRVA